MVRVEDVGGYFDLARECRWWSKRQEAGAAGERLEMWLRKQETGLGKQQQQHNFMLQEKGMGKMGQEPFN